MTMQNKEEQPEKTAETLAAERWTSKLHLAVDGGTIIECDNGRFELTFTENDVSGHHFDDPGDPTKSHPVTGKIRTVGGLRFIKLDEDGSVGQKHRAVLIPGGAGGPDTFLGNWRGLVPDRCVGRRRLEDQGEAIWVGTKVG